MKKLTVLVFIFLASCHSMNRHWLEVNTEKGEKILVNKDKIISVTPVGNDQSKMLLLNGDSLVINERYLKLRKRLKNSIFKRR